MLKTPMAQMLDHTGQEKELKGVPRRLRSPRKERKEQTGFKRTHTHTPLVFSTPLSFSLYIVVLTASETMEISVVILIVWTAFSHHP